MTATDRSYPTRSVRFGAPGDGPAATIDAADLATGTPRIEGFVIAPGSTSTSRRRHRMFALLAAIVVALLLAGTWAAARASQPAPPVPADVAYSADVRAAGVGIPDDYRFDVLAAGYAACSALDRGTGFVELLQGATSYGLGGLTVNATQGDAIIRAADRHLCPPQAPRS